MVNASPPFLCTCKIDKQKIIFCPCHKSAENMLAALAYVRDFLGAHSMAAKGDEGLKKQIILPYLDDVLARARKKPE